MRCTSDPRFLRGVRGRVRFALRGMSLVDLAAILPFYLPVLGVDLRSLRVLRLLRLVRIAKVGRYYSSLGRIKRAESGEVPVCPHCGEDLARGGLSVRGLE